MLDDEMWSIFNNLVSIIYLEKLLGRNKKIVLINEKEKEMGIYSEQNLRAVYYWAKINGYDSIWQLEKIKEVQQWGS